MDLTRGAAILLVIVHHSIVIPVHEGTASPPLVVLDAFFAPFRMPLLMFLSGMLLPRSLRKPPSEYFRGKARGLLWPYLLWSLIVLALAGELTLSIVPNILIYPPTYLWYLWFLFVFYAIAWVLRRLSIPLIPIIALALIFSVLLPDAYRLSRFAFLFAFFLAGWWWASSSDRVRLGRRTRWIVVSAGLLLAIAASVLSALGFALRYEAGFAWGTAGLIAAVALGLPSLQGRRWETWFEYVGRNSIVFYVSHYPVIYILDLVLLGALAEPALTVLSAIAAIGVGVLLSLARERFPVLRWLFEWPARPRASARRDVGADSSPPVV